MPSESIVGYSFAQPVPSSESFSESVSESADATEVPDDLDEISEVSSNCEDRCEDSDYQCTDESWPPEMASEHERPLVQKVCHEVLPTVRPSFTPVSFFHDLVAPMKADHRHKIRL